MLKAGLRPSRFLAVVLALAHGAAIAVVMMVDLPPWAKFIAVAILLVHLLVVVGHQALLLGADAAMAIEISSDNKVSVQTRADGWSEYEVLGSTYAMPWLTVLNLQQSDSGLVRRVTILPDSLHADEFRRLRVWLRWKDDRSEP